MKKLAFLFLLVVLVYAYRHEKPANWRGMPAPAEPLQTSDHLPHVFRKGDFAIIPLAHYHVTAVVLSRERYFVDNAAVLSPIDLALGWGPMSIANAINELSISQDHRFYRFSYSAEPPLDPDVIATHSANTHCIPANDQVRSQLLALRRHDMVTLEGLLIEADGLNGSTWRSSLTRDDTGNGACEIMWVTSCSAHSL